MLNVCIIASKCVNKIDSIEKNNGKIHNYCVRF